MVADQSLTDEELAAIQVVIWLMEQDGVPLDRVQVQEVWPTPSPWRWALVG